MTATASALQDADRIVSQVIDPIRSLRAAAERPPDKRTAAATQALAALARSGMDAATEAIARDFVKRERLLQPLAAFDRIVREARSESGQQGESERKSASTELVEIACERYEFGRGDGGETFAVAKVGPRIALMLRGGRTSLRGQLARDYFIRTGRAAAQQALADALMVIEGIAQEEDESRLYLRTAMADGALWLDLGDQSGRAVRITAAGWSTEESAPVLFKRTALNGPLPDPVPGGSLASLWNWLNVAKADRPLVASWLAAALFPDIPHPVLGIFGEQGTGKTTAAKVLAMLLDPGPVPVRKPPRDAEAWVTAAAGSWLVAIDNMSDIQPWLSDSLCRAVTGDGDVRRKLYTDGELAVFSYRRCVILNGIDTGAMQADLADRLLPVDLAVITEEQRRPEEDIWPSWRDAHPRVLGALLDMVSRVMAALPGIQLERKPRMADFARIIAAVGAVVDTEEARAALARYVGRGADLAADGLSGNSFAVAITKTMTSEFYGTSADLLRQLTPAAEAGPVPRDWPKDGRAVTTLLHRIAPALRKLGWTFLEERDSHTKLIRWKFAPPERPEKAREDHRSSPRPPQQGGDAVTAAMSGDESGPSQDGEREGSGGPNGTLALLRDRLGAEPVDSYPVAANDAGPGTALCIAPGPSHRARNGCRTCWDHAYLEKSA
jgi:hypothetical protein